MPYPDRTTDAFRETNASQIEYKYINHGHLLAQITMALRVEFLLPMNLSRLGGNVIRTTELYTGLKKLGIDISSVIPVNSLPELTSKLFPYREYAQPQPSNPYVRYIITELFNQYLIPDWTLRSEADVIHVDLAHLFPISKLRQLVKKQNVVFDMHSVPALDLEAFIPRVIRKPVMSGLLNMHGRIVKNAPCIAVSYKMKEYLIKTYGIEGHNISIIWPGVNLELSSQSVRQYAKDFEYLREESAPMLLFVGTLEPTEGLDTVIDAMPKIKRTFPRARFVIAGGGPDEGRLKRIVREKRLNDDVLFLGWVPHSQTFALQSHADILLSPLVLPAEGSGLNSIIAPLKIPQYLAAGKPIITSRVGDVPLMVRHGREAIVLEAPTKNSVTSAILDIMESPDIAAEMGRNCLERAKQLSWESASKKLRDFYERVLAGHGPR